MLGYEQKTFTKFIELEKIVLEKEKKLCQQLYRYTQSRRSTCIITKETFVTKYI
jgi:hypothetical protein